jgi:hypothetical protein
MDCPTRSKLVLTARAVAEGMKLASRNFFTVSPAETAKTNSLAKPPSI